MGKPNPTHLFAAALLFTTFQNASGDELARLQNLRAAQIRQVDQKYVEALGRLKSDYLRAGNLEKANAVEAEIKKYRVSFNLGNIGLAEVDVDGKFYDLKDGGPMYTNRGYKWTDIPRRFSDWDVLVRPGGGIAKLELSVNSPGLVYLAISKDDIESFIKEGWEKVASCNGREVFIVEKSLRNGTHVVESTGFFSARVIRPKPDQN